MSQTSEIIALLRVAGVPMNVDQIAEQLPHILRTNVASICSQYKKAGKLTAQVEDQRVVYALSADFAASAGACDAEETADSADVEADQATDLGEDECEVEKPPTQSFSVPSLDLRDSMRDALRRLPAIEAVGTPALALPAFDRAGRGEHLDPPMDVSPWPARDRLRAFPPAAAGTVSEPSAGEVRAQRERARQQRLTRELAAAVLARWPGEIPYDVQRLISSAASLPL